MLQIKTVPVLFAGLLNSHGNKGPAEIPAKRDYIFTDCLRSALLADIPFKMPPSHPFNPLLSLRSAVSLQDEESRLNISVSLLRACWGEGKDIANVEVVRQIFKNSNLDADDIIQRSSQDSAKDQLRRNTEEAVRSGIFGVPSIDINGEIFWGSDRLDHLIAQLDSQFSCLDLPRFRANLQRIPRGSDRKLHRESKK